MKRTVDIVKWDFVPFDSGFEHKKRFISSPDEIDITVIIRVYPLLKDIRTFTFFLNSITLPPASVIMIDSIFLRSSSIFVFSTVCADETSFYNKRAIHWVPTSFSGWDVSLVKTFDCLRQIVDTLFSLSSECFISNPKPIITELFGVF